MSDKSVLPLLQKLFNKPEIAFIQVSKLDELFFKALFKKYCLFILTLLLSASLIKYSINYKSIGYLLKKACIQPTIILIAFIVFLHVLSIIIEESVFRFDSKLKNNLGMKICFLSAIPPLGMSPFILLPFIGRFILVFSIIHWIYLIWIGSRTLLFFPGINIIPWFIAVILSCTIIFLLFFIILNLFKLTFQLF